MGAIDAYILAPLQMGFDSLMGRRSLKMSNFVVGERLGEGSFGVVYAGAILPKDFPMEERLGKMKRRMDNDDRFKERVILKKVSQTPNFRDSKAAQEILMQMKNLIELTKQLRSETNPNETPTEEPLLAAVKAEQIENRQEGEMSASQHQSEKKEEDLKELLGLGKGEFSGTSLVGGSPIGWNFFVYPGQKPIFYGVSKEIALARRVAK